MREYRQHYVDGRWVNPIQGVDSKVINPATEEVAGFISLGSPADVDRAVQAAHRAFECYSRTTRQERVELLGNIGRVFERRLDDVAQAVTEEMGAPLHTLSKPAQAMAGLVHFQVAAAVLPDFAFEKPMGTALIVREAAGVCGLITPWNWPINQITCKVAPALAAGCTMVLKPSVLAPFCAHVLAEILHEAGLAPGVFNLVDGAGTTIGKSLAAHPLVDMISFTGSTRAGIDVDKTAADTVKRVALELGGKSANVILEDADFSQAIPHGVLSMMSNTGQSCNAPSRMLVPASRLAEAEAVAAATAAQIVVGDPLAPTTFVGPIANARQFKKVQGLIQKGIDEGAKLVCGGAGKPADLERGYYAKPTVFVASNDMTIAREEIFGPVLCIIPYKDEEDAVRIANDTLYGLSGYVFSGSLEHARAIALRMRTGQVHLNGAPADLTAPFGGYKQSGLGREWGIFGIEEFLQIKALVGNAAAA